MCLNSCKNIKIIIKKELLDISRLLYNFKKSSQETKKYNSTNKNNLNKFIRHG